LFAHRILCDKIRRTSQDKVRFDHFTFGLTQLRDLAITKLDMRSSTDVLVVGAGPVGLLLACELQRQGVNHLLVERTQQRSYFCKALGVTPRTLELFDALGVVEQAID
jgi:threonine dehydrogenase-like Zn-dependent dehydrogenase